MNEAFTQPLTLNHFRFEAIVQTKSKKRARLLNKEPNPTSPPNTPPEEETALHWACETSPVILEIITVLLEGKVDINKKDAQGRSPLYLACLNPFSCQNDISFLLEKGANLQSKTHNDDTPLHGACESDLPDFHIIKLLIEKGACVHQRNKKGETPLTVACKNKHIIYPLIKFLMEKSFLLNEDTEAEMLPLHLACENENASIHLVHYLIEEGFDVNQTDKNHQTPLHLACRNSILDKEVSWAPLSKTHQSDIIERLIERGGDMLRKDGNGKTPLYYYAHTTHIPNKIRIVGSLLKQGKSPSEIVFSEQLNNAENNQIDATFRILFELKKKYPAFCLEELERYLPLLEGYKDYIKRNYRDFNSLSTNPPVTSGLSFWTSSQKEISDKLSKMMSEKSLSHIDHLPEENTFSVNISANQPSDLSHPTLEAKNTSYRGLKRQRAEN